MENAWELHYIKHSETISELLESSLEITPMFLFYRVTSIKSLYIILPHPGNYS